MRSPLLLLVLLCLPFNAGCLSTLLGLAVAPAAVGTQAAGTAAQAAGSRAPIDNQTVNDLDRILAAHPDAENAEELAVLRDRIAKQPRVADEAQGPAPIDDAERRARWDRRVPPPEQASTWKTGQQKGPSGDQLTMDASKQAEYRVRGVRDRPAPQCQEGPATSQVVFTGPTAGKFIKKKAR